MRLDRRRTAPTSDLVHVLPVAAPRISRKESRSPVNGARASADTCYRLSRVLRRGVRDVDMPVTEENPRTHANTSIHPLQGHAWCHRARLYVSCAVALFCDDVSGEVVQQQLSRCAMFFVFWDQHTRTMMMNKNLEIIGDGSTNERTEQLALFLRATTHTHTHMPKCRGSGQWQSGEAALCHICTVFRSCCCWGGPSAVRLSLDFCAHAS